jgi:hypothetical protein
MSILLSQREAQSLIIEGPDLAAGADLVAEVGHRFRESCRIVQARIIFVTATVGVAAANELTIDLISPAGTFASSGALAANQAAGVVSVPALTAANAMFVAGQNFTYSVTQAGVADIGRWKIELDYLPGAS